MGFFDKIREKYRDRTRDNVCAGLRELGIDAQMAPRGRTEERLGKGNSLGVIDIANGPIRWVNIYIVRPSGEGSLPFEREQYYTDYGVPDPRLRPQSSKPHYKSVHKKTALLRGQVIDFYWKGKDFGLGILDRLNDDTSLKDSLMKSPDVEIQVADYFDDSDMDWHRCWVITEELRAWYKKTETMNYYHELWNCYQAIA
jgi:hypothetical protein